MAYLGIKNVGQVPYRCSNFYQLDVGYHIIVDASEAWEKTRAFTNDQGTGFSLGPKLTVMSTVHTASIQGYSGFKPYEAFPTHIALPTSGFTGAG